MIKERWSFRVYLAGYSRDLEYRSIAIDKYGAKIDFLDPMTISWKDVNENVQSNMTDTWIVKRDKRLIDHCDILVAKVEYLPEGQIMIGTFMEILYAFERGIPVYLISSSDTLLENPWLKFHVKNRFKTIEDCFDFILGVEK